MLYRIEATSIYCFNKKDECERILKRYPCLNSFGFRIEKKNEMIYESYIELDSLDELNELMFELDTLIVLSPGIIEIYDECRE
jgi:hypothetical protein